MGCFNKLVLLFPKAFWDVDVGTFGYVNLPESMQGKEHAYDPESFAASRGKYYLFWYVDF